MTPIPDQERVEVPEVEAQPSTPTVPEYRNWDLLREQGYKAAEAADRAALAARFGLKG